jgi:hypothetical protein
LAVVKERKAWLVSLLDVKPVRTCTDGAPGSHAILWCARSALAVPGTPEELLSGPTIRGNCEKGDDDELTGTFVAVFLLIRLFGADIFKE